MKRYYTLLLLIFCVAGLGLSTAYNFLYAGQTVRDENVATRIENAQLSALTIARSWIDAIDEQQLIDSLWHRSTYEQWTNDGISLYLYKGDSLQFWANHPYPVEVDSMDYDSLSGIATSPDYTLIIRTLNNGNRRAIIAINLVTRGKINQALFANPSTTLLPINAATTGQSVVLPYCKFNISTSTNDSPPLWVNAIGWLALFIGIFTLKQRLRHGSTPSNAVQKLLLFASCIASIRALTYFVDIPHGGSHSLSSLDSLLVTQLFIWIIVQQAYQLRYKIRQQIDLMKVPTRYLLLVLFTILINGAVAYFHYGMVQTIYNNTNVDLYNILSIEPRTIMFYFICAVFVALRVIYGRFFAIVLHQFPFWIRLTLSTTIMIAIVTPIEQYIGETGYILVLFHVLFLSVAHLSRPQNDARVFIYDLFVFTAYITLFSAIEASSAKSMMAERYAAEMSTRSELVNQNAITAFSDSSRSMTYTIITNNQVVLKAGHKLDAQVLIPFLNTNKDTLVRIGNSVHNIKKCRTSDAVIAISYQRATLLDILALFSYLFIWLFVVSGIILRISPINIYRHYNPRSMLYRIRAIIFGVVLLSMITVVWIVYQYSGNSYREQQRQLLNTSVQSLLHGYNIYSQTNVKQDILVNWYKNRGSALNCIVNLYDLNAKRIGGSEEHFSGSHMYDQAFYRLSVMGMPYYERSKEVNSVQLSVAFTPMLWHGQKIGYMSVVLIDNENIASRYALLGNIFNVFVVLFLLTIGLSMVLYSIISKPLSVLSDALGRIGQMQKVPIRDNVHYTDEVGSLIAQYNKMIDYLHESYAALARAEREGAWREMARQVAHEIKNPLTPMRLKIQMLQRSRRNGSPIAEQQIDSTLEMLLQQINILNKIATEFSDLARMPQAPAVRIELTDLLRNTVGLYSANECSEVIFEPQSSNGIFVCVEYAGLTRVIVNLLQNAMQALQGYGVVIVKLYVRDNLAVIEVRDNGVGIPTDILARIFEPNFTTKSSGSGLGLAISRQIIESSNGTITAANLDGGGAIFTITIPMC